jgi:hypothetical protein
MPSKASQGDSKNLQQHQAGVSGTGEHPGTFGDLPPTMSGEYAHESSPPPYRLTADDGGRTPFVDQNRAAARPLDRFAEQTHLNKLASELESDCKQYQTDRNGAKGNVLLSPFAKKRPENDESQLKAEHAQLESRAADLYGRFKQNIARTHEDPAGPMLQRIRYEKYGVYVRTNEDICNNLSKLRSASGFGQSKRRFAVVEHYAKEIKEELRAYHETARATPGILKMLEREIQPAVSRAVLEHGLIVYKKLASLVRGLRVLDDFSTPIMGMLLHNYDHAINPIRIFCREKDIQIDDLVDQYKQLGGQSGVPPTKASTGDPSSLQQAEQKPAPEEIVETPGGLKNYLRMYSAAKEDDRRAEVEKYAKHKQL